jgi:hypothetical protein
MSRTPPPGSRRPCGRSAWPTADDVEALVDCLAGPAIPQQHLLAQLAERETAFDLLTKDQANGTAGRPLPLLRAFLRPTSRATPRAVPTRRPPPVQLRRVPLLGRHAPDTSGGRVAGD